MENILECITPEILTYKREWSLRATHTEARNWSQTQLLNEERISLRSLSKSIVHLCWFQHLQNRNKQKRYDFLNPVLRCDLIPKIKGTSRITGHSAVNWYISKILLIISHFFIKCEPTCGPAAVETHEILTDKKLISMFLNLIDEKEKRKAVNKSDWQEIDILVLKRTSF